MEVGTYMADSDISFRDIWVVMFWVFMFMMLRYDDGLPIAIIRISPWGYLGCCIMGTFRGYPC